MKNLSYAFFCISKINLIKPSIFYIFFICKGKISCSQGEIHRLHKTLEEGARDEFSFSLPLRKH
jgi:hypothetical protein